MAAFILPAIRALDNLIDANSNLPSLRPAHYKFKIPGYKTIGGSKLKHGKLLMQPISAPIASAVLTSPHLLYGGSYEKDKKLSDALKAFASIGKLVTPNMRAAIAARQARLAKAALSGGRKRK